MCTNLVTVSYAMTYAEFGEKKTALGRAPCVVAPITMAATPADPARGGDGDSGCTASSTRTMTTEVSAGHRFPRSL